MYSSDLVYDVVAGCDKYNNFLMLLTLQKLVVTASISSGRMELLIRKVATPDRVQYRKWIRWTHIAVANPLKVKERFFMKHGVPYTVELNYDIPSGEGGRLVRQTMRIGAVCESRWRKEFSRNGPSVSTLWINITRHLRPALVKQKKEKNREQIEKTVRRSGVFFKYTFTPEELLIKPFYP